MWRGGEIDMGGGQVVEGGEEEGAQQTKIDMGQGEIAIEIDRGIERARGRW